MLIRCLSIKTNVRMHVPKAYLAWLLQDLEVSPIASSHPVIYS